MLVMTGMFATASLTYVAPALAHDEDTMPSVPSDSGDTQNQNNNDMSNPPANNMSNPSSNNMGNPTDGNMNPSGTTSDQPTPDTATGDDDY